MKNEHIGDLLSDILYAEDLTKIESRIADLNIDDKEILRYIVEVDSDIENYAQGLENAIRVLQSNINELQSDRRCARNRQQYIKSFKKRLEDEMHDKKD